MMKNFDKNNWYILEKTLTQEQFVNVCKYLVENCHNIDNNDRVMRASKGVYGGWGECCQGFFDVTGVVNGECFVDDLPSVDFENCVKITYEEFEQHLLNDSVQDDGGWIEWDGGECPVSGDTLVECEFKSGEFTDAYQANCFSWKWLNQPYDIIAYRIIKPSKSVSDESCTNTPEKPEKPSQSFSERLAAIQNDLLEVIKEVGCNITVYNDEITINLEDDYGDKEFTWRDDRHSVEDLQKLLDGVKLIKEFEDK